MPKVLVLSSGDWGDEFDLEGFAVFERDIWENIKEGIPDKPFEAYFGSNEFVTFESREEYLSHLVEKEITEEEYGTLLQLLNLKHPSPSPYVKGLMYGLFVIESENY